jgi:hypothetical protein
MVVSRGRKGKREDQDGPPGIDDIDAYSNHVVKFSLAGIRTIREEAEKKPRDFKRQRGIGTALERE